MATTNGHIDHHDHFVAHQAAPDTVNASDMAQALAHDEIGWYFVQQYYTTMSKQPDRLHLFYSKLSWFVCGNEDESSPSSRGRGPIGDRIRSLEFEDVKVRIDNVDSQPVCPMPEINNIVIQVIGEISNKGKEPKKFVQTFVLAQQPSGYYVLNDIMRYLKDDDQEVPETEEAPAVDISVATEPVQPESAAELTPEASESGQRADVEQEIVTEASVEQQTKQSAPEPAPSSAAANVTEPAIDAEAGKGEVAPDPEKMAQELAEEEVKIPEVPKDPTPSPVVGPVKNTIPVPTPAPAEPEKKRPPKPMTWASRAAAAAGPPRAAVAIPKPAVPAIPVQPRLGPVLTHANLTPQPSPAIELSAALVTPKDLGSEWETAQTKRHNRPQSLSASVLDKENAMAYIKFVTDKVKTEDLRLMLEKYGELVYFDINRTKNCAFVEFQTAAGYHAAVAANPHTVNGETIQVEQRRPKPEAYGGGNYKLSRGGMAGRGRGGYGGQARGRGSNGTSRGRGPQSMNT